MKTLFFLFICLISTGAFCQTYTFSKNQEIARFNEVKSSASAIQSTFNTTSEIDENYLVELASIMEYKDGYVELSKIDSHTVRVLHENFLQPKDIIDVMNTQNINWQLFTNEISSFK